MKIFIPIKHNSQRVPNKNFRDFQGKPLWEHTVDKLKEFEVFIDTDSQEILKQCESKPWVTAYLRDKRLRGDSVSVCDLLRNYVQEYQVKDLVCQLHVTSPLLNIDDIKLGELILSKENYDSILTYNKIQKRVWRKESYGLCPVNHNPMKLEQTQDLPPLLEENSYFYMFQSDVMIEYGTRVGVNPFLLEINYPYNLDIDTEEDWQRLAKL